MCFETTRRLHGCVLFLPPTFKIHFYIMEKAHKNYHLNQFFLDTTRYDLSSTKRNKEPRESTVSGLRQKRYKKIIYLEYLTVLDNQSDDSPIDQRMVSYCCCNK